VTVLEHSHHESRVLLTAAKDFGDLVFRQRRANHGVLLIRLMGLNPISKANLVASAIRRHGPELFDAFAVLTPHNLRIRRDPTGRSVLK
jgi:predicted nuclease of predicted toxin-antitoxin system